MTKFQHEPIEKIIVKNLVHENIENLISECNYHRQAGVLWTNGIILLIPRLNYGGGEKKYDDMKKNVQYLEKVVFVKCPKYVTTITKKNCVDYVRVLDYSNNNKINELANWIQSQPIWKTIPEPTPIGGMEIDE